MKQSIIELVERNTTKHLYKNIDLHKLRQLMDEADTKRDVYISKMYCNYQSWGYTFFGLNGSPPKGSAVYSPNDNTLVILDGGGNIVQLYGSVYIKGLDKLPDESIFHEDGSITAVEKLPGGTVTKHLESSCSAILDETERYEEERQIYIDKFLADETEDAILIFDVPYPYTIKIRKKMWKYNDKVYFNYRYTDSEWKFVNDSDLLQKLKKLKIPFSLCGTWCEIGPVSIDTLPKIEQMFDEYYLDVDNITFDG